MKPLLTRPDGTVVLAGLQWQVSAEVEGYGPTQVRLLAKGEGCAGYLLRAKDRNVAFLPQQFAGRRAVAFAAVMAEAIGGAFVGIFHVEDVWVYVAATEEGYILADGERIYDTASAARARLDEESALYTTLYAPADWSQAEALDSGSLLTAIDWDSVQPFEQLANKQNSNRKILLGGTAATAVVIAAGLGWHFWQADEVPVAPVGIPAPAPPPPDPWRSVARPEVAAQACLAARADMAETVHQGWVLKDLVCDVAGHTISATLSPYTLANQVPTLAPNLTAKLAPDGATIIVTGRLEIAPSDRSAEKPSPTNTLKFRNFLFALTNKPTWQAAERNIQFDLNTEIPLPVLANGMQKFNTLIVNRFDYMGGKWRVQGTISNQ